MGGSVRLQSLTSGEMRQLRQSLLNPDGRLNRKRGDKLQYLLLSWTIVDDNGSRLFSEEDALGSDFDSIDGAMLAVLYEHAKNWTGFLSDGDFTAIEDAVKNSESTREN
jgi:hypothetical protein